MTKEMQKHAAYICSHLLHATPSIKKKLYAYHLARMRDFQRERLIHLIVTATVAMITIIIVALAYLTRDPAFLLLSLILLPLLLTYLLHYRSLENGVQSLYFLTDKLRSL